MGMLELNEENVEMVLDEVRPYLMAGDCSARLLQEMLFTESFMACSSFPCHESLQLYKKECKSFRCPFILIYDLKQHCGP